MAEGIAKIIGDKALREAFSKASLKIAKTHNLDHTIAAFVKLYQRTITNKQEEIARRPVGFVDRIKESELAEYMEFWSSEDRGTKK
jgi:hypothetical protein